MDALASDPWPSDLHDAGDALTTRPAPLHFYERVGSTNDLALALAAAGAVHGTAVLADLQEAGRGRRGRSWWSPPGAGMYLSVVVRVDRLGPGLPVLTLAAGVALAGAGVAVTTHAGASGATVAGRKGRVSVSMPPSDLCELMAQHGLIAFEVPVKLHQLDHAHLVVADAADLRPHTLGQTAEGTRQRPDLVAAVEFDLFPGKVALRQPLGGAGDEPQRVGDGAAQDGGEN